MNRQETASQSTQNNDRKTELRDHTESVDSLSQYAGEAGSVAPFDPSLRLSISEENKRKGRRDPHKERGSLLSNPEIPAAADARPRGKKVKRIKAQKLPDKQVSRDVYIPSAVSVDRLARLLGVRLGTCTYSSPDVYLCQSVAGI